jgi:hypothetical protein
MIPVKRSRKIVSNHGLILKKSIVDTKKKVQYEWASDVNIVATKSDESFLGIPIGTQFHWVSFGEIPSVGDSFIVGKRNAGVNGSVVGTVSKVDKHKMTCKINGLTIKIWDLSFRIVNPSYVFATRRKQLKKRNYEEV